MGRTAILILAHDRPAHFARLVGSLVCDWIDIFVHVDRKAQLDEFVAAAPPEVAFLDGARRIRVAWGGLSVVRATLHLLEAALASPRRFERFCLLSGADFPIKPLPRIRERLATEIEFMRVDHRLAGPRPTTHCHHVRYLHFMDGRWRGHRRLSGVLPRPVRRTPPLYQGSQWWSLTRDCVEHVLRVLRDNPGYLRFHRWTKAPDEIVFQSIVKASPFAAAISHDFERPSSEWDPISNEHGCTYVDWQTTGGAFPKVLTLEDYDRLSRSHCLFARKFDQTRSTALRERLESTWTA